MFSQALLGSIRHQEVVMSRTSPENLFHIPPTDPSSGWSIVPSTRQQRQVLAHALTSLIISDLVRTFLIFPDLLSCPSQSSKLEKKKTRKIIPGQKLRQDRPEKNSAKRSIRSCVIPSPRQTSIDKPTTASRNLNGVRSLGASTHPLVTVFT